jgi:hypothetical protein
MQFLEKIILKSFQIKNTFNPVCLGTKKYTCTAILRKKFDKKYVRYVPSSYMYMSYVEHLSSFGRTVQLTLVEDHKTWVP